MGINNEKLGLGWVRRGKKIRERNLIVEGDHKPHTTKRRWKGGVVKG